MSRQKSSNYLLIGLGPVNPIGGQPGVGQAVNVNNFELGANKAPVPSTSDFLGLGAGNTGGGSGGAGLRGNAPNIPLNAEVVGTGIGGLGNIAITSPGGVFNFQNLRLYADLGIRCAQSVANCDAGTSNSFFNDPNQFPNTFAPAPGTPAGTTNNVDSGTTDVLVGPGDAVQSTRIDEPNSAGVTGGFDFTSLLAELNAARTFINALMSTGTIDTSANGGKLTKVIDPVIFTGSISGSVDILEPSQPSDYGNTEIRLSDGLNVIDLFTGGSDFLLEQTNLIIEGDADDFAIFRVPNNINFLSASRNILIGDGGIGLNNVLFYTERSNNNTHFNFQNSVINGIAFWSLGSAGGEINFQNSQGCLQIVADKITLDDVRFNRCGFNSPDVDEQLVSERGKSGAARYGAPRPRRRPDSSKGRCVIP